MEGMGKGKKFSLRDRLNSLRYAIRGIYVVVSSQPNAWIQAIALVVVLAAGIYFDFTQAEWCWVVLAIGLVWMSEALNSGIEFLSDLSSPDYHPLVRNAKDVAAGAVLIAIIAALLIGILVIWPYIYEIFEE